MFMKYLACLTKVVKKKVARMLPKRYAIALDGWSVGDTHFVAVFATFPADTAVGYGKVLLGLLPMENEENQGAQEHYDYVEYILLSEVVGERCGNLSGQLSNYEIICSKSRSMLCRLSQPSF